MVALCLLFTGSLGVVMQAVLMFALMALAVFIAFKIHALQRLASDILIVQEQQNTATALVLVSSNSLKTINNSLKMYCPCGLAKQNWHAIKWSRVLTI
jgi:hypothetical protein